MLDCPEEFHQTIMSGQGATKKGEEDERRTGGAGEEASFGLMAGREVKRWWGWRLVFRQGARLTIVVRGIRIGGKERMR